MTKESYIHVTLGRNFQQRRKAGHGHAGRLGAYSFVVQYLASGAIDRSRSHYTVRGRKVSGRAFRQWSRGRR